MKGSPRSAAGRLLRSGRLIVVELLAIGVFAGLAASLPQEPDADGIRRFAEAAPIAGAVTRALRLHSVLRSGWFFVTIALATASLLAVQYEQWRRVARLWRTPVGAAPFANAPYRRVLSIPAGRPVPDRPIVTTSGRIGVLGSPLFHLGVLIVVLGALGRLLWSSEAVVRFVEGETLGSDPAAYAAQRDGWLAGSFRMDVPLHLAAVEVDRYESGGLRWITGHVAVGGPGGPRRTVAVNAPLDVGGVQLTVSASHGLMAVFERASGGRSAVVPAWLEFSGAHAKGRVDLGDGSELRMRATDAGGRPSGLEIRLTRGGALLFAGAMRVGETVGTGSGDGLRLVALPYWVQAQVAKDGSRPVFYAGLVAGLLGAAMMFGVVRIDSAVFRDGDGLVVAMRPHRFAPLYAARFERLCKEWTG